MTFETLDIEKLGAALILWALVALIIEEVAKAIFDWKLYRDSLGGKGFKTPIIFLVSISICFIFKIDIFVALIGSVGIVAASNWLSCGITALLLIGGSGTIFRFLNRLREAKNKIEGGNP